MFRVNIPNDKGNDLIIPDVLTREKADEIVSWYGGTMVKVTKK